MKRYFKHKITGKIEQYPERYGALLSDVLEPVDDPGTCLDCGPIVEETESEPEVVEYDPDFLVEEEY